MLKYLMKYDLKKMLKMLVWFYAISVVLAGIARFFAIWNNVQILKIISMVFAGFTYSAVANVIINTFIHILMRFSHSFYKDESYLTHTMPVKKSSLILSKYLSSLIVIFASVVVSFLSLFVVLYSPTFVQNIKMLLESAISGFNMSSGVFVLLVVAILFAQTCALMSFAFTAIVKGNSYNQKRGVKGFLWFVLYYFVCSLTSLILAIIVTAITGDLTSLFSNQMTGSAFLSILITSLITNITYAIMFYFLCKREFAKGVNVD